jgi:hypothetical protein
VQIKERIHQLARSGFDKWVSTYEDQIKQLGLSGILLDRTISPYHKALLRNLFVNICTLSANTQNCSGDVRT